MQHRTATIDIPNRFGPPLTLVHVSDTHNNNSYPLPKVPYEGSILVHSGDWTNRGTIQEHAAFGDWIRNLQQQFQIIIVVSGNHERGFDKISKDQQYDLIFKNCKRLPEPIKKNPSHGDDGGDDLYGQSGVILLHDQSIKVGGLKIHGTPWGLCGPAFCLFNQDEVRDQKFAMIPSDTHLLITHNPPWMIADVAWVKHQTKPGPCEFCFQLHPNYEHWGDWVMLQHMRRVRPPIFMCGHVHDDASLFVEKIALDHTKKDGESFDCLISNAAMDIRRKANVISIPGNAPPKQQPQQQQEKQQSHQQEEIQKNTNTRTRFDDVPPPVAENDDDMKSFTVSYSSDFTSDHSENNNNDDDHDVGGDKLQQQKKDGKNPNIASSFIPVPFPESELLKSLSRVTNAAAAQGGNNTQQQQSFVQLTTASRGVALDRDWYDNSRETVMLWRLVRPRQINQTWRFDFINNNNNQNVSSSSNTTTTLKTSVGRTILASHVRISCLLPSSQQQQDLEVGYLRAITASANSGVKCVAPSSLSQEQIKLVEPSTRWFVVPIPGTLKQFEERSSSSSSKNKQQQTVVNVKTIEVLLLSQSQTNHEVYFALRANDLNDDNHNDEQNQQQQQQGNTKQDMTKSELEMVPFELTTNLVSVSPAYRWVVRM